MILFSDKKNLTLHLHTIKNKLGFSAHLNQKNVFYLNFIIRTKAAFFIPCLE